ncbi:zinc-dependent alcohol dehydrogenase family protein [Streptomyces tsukubensis]|uniref:Alcohol dehydrogenase n=1 Tax=Streptomyces tsukubensis TaxID=83656 RepID=A0A1V4AH16_9ACTN|nr:zinc-dependent alcohol dehydrogenase family protein [Streptomyces tsukubensis]OON82911.1 alcohol dehydrogenase [Streptomyces tsukubensis]QFR91904.1 zinc-binding dehydrogenase [Streptomyces tsukubensis]
MARAVRSVVREFGPAAEVVRTERYEPAAPGPGQVAVRMLLAGVNPSDLVTISGAYASRTDLPFVPGYEGVGVVEATGTGVTGLRAGLRVLPLGSAGAWQQTKVTAARWCFPVDPALTDEEAATAYINPLTALLMVRRHTIATGARTVVINAAASAIGQILIRMLNKEGISPIALVRRRRSLDRLPGDGLTAAVCTEDRPAADAVREITRGRGPDVVLDAVGGTEGTELGRALADGGTLVHYGLLSGRPLSWELAQDRPDARIVLFRLRDWVHAAPPDRLTAALTEVFALVREGTAASPVASTHPLSHVREALERDAEPGRRGKVLIRLDS